MKLVQIGVAFPGAHDFPDRKPLVIDGGSVAFRRNPRDSPFDAMFFEQPFLSVDQKAGKSPADMSKSDKCEIDLSRFLFHRGFRINLDL
jgi:hypothetical protein